MIPTDKALLTHKENKWLIQNYLEENKALPSPRAHIEVDGVRMTQLDAFVTRVMEHMEKEFPYRHPDTPKRDIEPRMQHLQYDTDEWPAKFKERLHNCFNHFKRQQREGKSLLGDDDPSDDAEHGVEEDGDEEMTSEGGDNDGADIGDEGVRLVDETPDNEVEMGSSSGSPPKESHRSPTEISGMLRVSLK
ncbi:hypothetical protein FRC11_002355 [Ceratobasidium sp. 423]|nr:hypothetical protein FRC11_002355 [Ceratobasidium sp. 423]